MAKSISVIRFASSKTYLVPTGTFSTAQRGNSTCAPVTAVNSEKPDSAGIALKPTKNAGGARNHSCLRALIAALSGWWTLSTIERTTDVLRPATSLGPVCTVQLWDFALRQGKLGSFTLFVYPLLNSPSLLFFLLSFGN